MSSTIWIGNIQFNGTSVPVKLHLAVRENTTPFHLLHKIDRVTLHQKMICAYDHMPVPREEQVKGFPVAERKYIIIDPEELEGAEPESSRAIAIHEFVKTEDIDPIFVKRTYFLEAEASATSYAALAAALRDMSVFGICTWVTRKRAYFGAVESTGKTLRLITLRYADEVIQSKLLSLEQFTLSEKEIAIGCELIYKLAVRFEPQKYVNEHQKKLQELIAKKAAGQKIHILQPRHVKATQSSQLLEALQESLKKVA